MATSQDKIPYQSPRDFAYNTKGVLRQFHLVATEAVSVDINRTLNTTAPEHPPYRQTFELVRLTATVKGRECKSQTQFRWTQTQRARWLPSKPAQLTDRLRGHRPPPSPLPTSRELHTVLGEQCTSGEGTSRAHDLVPQTRQQKTQGLHRRTEIHDFSGRSLADTEMKLRNTPG